MGTRYILEAFDNNRWSEVKDLDKSISNEQLKAQAAGIALASGLQTRIRKVSDKILFTSPKPLKTMVNAA